jgi:hypothetical protein
VGYEPAEIGRMLKWIDHVDLVAGHRMLEGRPYRQDWRDRSYRLLNRALFAVRLRDLGCWYVLAKRPVFSHIPIQSDGQFAHAEVIAKANFLGFVMSEVPVTYKANDHASSTILISPHSIYSEMYHVFTRPRFDLTTPEAMDTTCMSAAAPADL